MPAVTSGASSGSHPRPRSRCSPRTPPSTGSSTPMPNRSTPAAVVSARVLSLCTRLRLRRYHGGGGLQGNFGGREVPSPRGGVITAVRYDSIGS
jgi:hypothetical protein